MAAEPDNQTAPPIQGRASHVSWFAWTWVGIPVVCLAVILTLRPPTPVSETVRPVAPETVLSTPLQIEATGREFEWWFRYPGADTVLGTDDDVELRRRLLIPLNADVAVRVTSEDYVYTFLVDEAGIREIGVPDMWHSVTLHMAEDAVLDIPVDPLCAFRPLHDRNMGQLSIAGDSHMRTLFGSATLAK